MEISWLSDDDMLTFAVALKDKGTPVPEIAKKLTIKTGKNAGTSPSVASLYRALSPVWSIRSGLVDALAVSGWGGGSLALV
ncbi:hypothetical protein GXW82_10860 [Streptacidiphilus sp. 4-A2]|nr:hypothetical protein [Streptacidiphilus sp. 4-A2]